MTVDKSYQARENRADEFARRISLLLKHDWERVKLEAGFFLCRWVLEAKRLPLKCADGEISSEHRARKFLQKYKIRKLWAVVLAIAIVAGGILACLCCDRLRVFTDEGATTRVLADVGENDRESR